MCVSSVLVESSTRNPCTQKEILYNHRYFNDSHIRVNFNTIENDLTKGRCVSSEILHVKKVQLTLTNKEISWKS